eukprot:16377082-Heterocapsa_arctica.AAC.1
MPRPVTVPAAVLALLCDTMLANLVFGNQYCQVCHAFGGFDVWLFAPGLQRGDAGRHPQEGVAACRARGYGGRLEHFAQQ